MSTILCYGDSHVWGAIPGSIDPINFLLQRYAKNVRWPGVLQTALGEKFVVVEEAINGRTTTVDELVPGRPARNGLALLTPALEAHYPIAAVVLMLGTNDLKVQYKRSVEDIVVSMKQLIAVIRQSNKGRVGNAPQVFLIAPPPIIKIHNLHAQFNDTSIEMSRKLGAAYKQLAELEGCAFLDSASMITSSTKDGFHFDEEGHQYLGRRVAQEIEIMLV